MIFIPLFCINDNLPPFERNMFCPNAIDVRRRLSSSDIRFLRALLTSYGTAAVSVYSYYAL